MNTKKIDLLIGILNLAVFAYMMYVLFVQPTVVYVDSIDLPRNYNDIRTHQLFSDLKLNVRKSSEDKVDKTRGCAVVTIVIDKQL